MAKNIIFLIFSYTDLYKKLLLTDKNQMFEKSL